MAAEQPRRVHSITFSPVVLFNFYFQNWKKVQCPKILKTSKEGSRNLPIAVCYMFLFRMWSNYDVNNLYRKISVEHIVEYKQKNAWTVELSKKIVPQVKYVFALQINFTFERFVLEMVWFLAHTGLFYQNGKTFAFNFPSLQSAFKIFCFKIYLQIRNKRGRSSFCMKI